MSPSLSGLLESLEDTLTESMLSPELPVGGDRGVSLTGELAALLSAPRNSLESKGFIRHNKINRSQLCGSLILQCDSTSSVACSS